MRSVSRASTACISTMMASAIAFRSPSVAGVSGVIGAFASVVIASPVRESAASL